MNPLVHVDINLENINKVARNKGRNLSKNIDFKPFDNFVQLIIHLFVFALISPIFSTI